MVSPSFRLLNTSVPQEEILRCRRLKVKALQSNDHSGGQFGRGIALQAGRSRVRFIMESLGFFFRPQNGPAVDPASYRNEYGGYLLWVKAAGA
jgi:hypothetical protein